MAGLVICDNCGDKQFVPAVAHVVAMKKEGVEISPMRGRDACADHLLDVVEAVWRMNSREPKFHQILITSIRKDKP